jgi:putative ABC transport system substrate-binding protein
MRVETTGLLVILSLGFLAAPLAVDAEQAKKSYLMGTLDRAGNEEPNSLFWTTMRKLGWVEGQNLRVEHRLAERRDQLPALAAELVQLSPDLILTNGTPASLAAKRATNTIPIVFDVGWDPVESGLVASLPHPGGNLTGFVIGLHDEKRLEILAEALPQAKRVAVPGYDPNKYELDAILARTAQAHGVAIQGFAMTDPADFDFDSFFAAARSAGADAVLVPDVAGMDKQPERIVAAAAKNRMPTISFQRRFVQLGGLLFFGPTENQDEPRLAVLVDKILRGAKPADLPIEQPTTFELIVNLKTAKTLGVEFSPTFLARADEAIE